MAVKWQVKYLKLFIGDAVKALTGYQFRVKCELQR